MRFIRVTGAAGQKSLEIAYRHTPAQPNTESISFSVPDDVVEKVFNKLMEYLINLDEHLETEGGEIILDEVDSGSSDLSGSVLEYTVILKEDGGKELKLYLGRSPQNVSATHNQGFIFIPNGVVKKGRIDKGFSFLLKEGVRNFLNESANALRHSARERDFLQGKVD